MKIVQINWETGEVLEKGVLSKEHSNEDWIELYKKINAELAVSGSKLVWMISCC